MHVEDSSSLPLDSSPPTLSGDIVAGFLVSLIALPLCIAISIASGFPPFAGVLTAIIGGMVVSLFRTAPLTIKGPAAGLIVIVLGAVEELGQGDGTVGMRRALALVAAAGVIQVVLGLLKAGKYAELVPASAVRGMLGAIGIIITAKQIHVLLGVKPTATTPLRLIAEVPHSLVRANPVIAAIGLATLALMLAWPKFAKGRLARLPAPVAGLAFALPVSELMNLDTVHDVHVLGSLSATVGPRYLVSVPHALRDLIAFPDFAGTLSAVGAKYLVLFVLVGTIESLLSTKAIDGLDPLLRRSDLDKDLVAVGVGNTLAGLLGGLPMISEIVRSSANVSAGGRTGRANFAHGVFLLACVALIPALVHQIPLSALAAMLVLTGLRLASPSEFVTTKSIGKEQAAIYLATVGITLLEDLLLGIAAGFALEVAFQVVRGVKPRELARCAFDVREREGQTLVTVSSPAVFTNTIDLRKTLVDAPEDRPVLVDLQHARTVDHTVMAMLEGLRLARAKRRAEPMVIVGLASYSRNSLHPLASRYRPEQSS